MPPLRESYNPDLYVDAHKLTVDCLCDWIASRSVGVSRKSVSLLIAPPGFGKTWILHHLAHERIHQSHTLLCFVPNAPNSNDTIWFDRDILGKARPRLNPRTIPFNAGAPLANNIREFLAVLGTANERLHLVVVLDEIDQAPDLVAVEKQILAPLVLGGASVLLGVRSSVSFSQRELRNPQYIEEMSLAPFAFGDDQLQKRNDVHQVDLANLRQMLQDSGRGAHYAWDIPAVNTCLWEQARQQQQQTGTARITSNAVETCLSHVLGLDSMQDKEVLDHVRKIASWTQTTWTQTGLGRNLGISLSAVGVLTARLLSLNLAERSPDGVQSLRLVPSWRDFIR